MWASVCWQALGGIIVAVTIKYADNILRGFSQAIALIIGAIGSAVLFDFRLTLIFWIGIALVIGAVSTPSTHAQHARPARAPSTRAKHAAALSRTRPVAL